MANEHLFDDLIVRLLEIMDIFQPYTEISWGCLPGGVVVVFMFCEAIFFGS